MNSLVKNGHLKEMACGTNFSYILNDNKIFLPTEYKVLLGQKKGGFVKCMKMLYNGKIQLYYVTSGLKPLSLMLSGLDADTFMIIAGNLLADIIEIKNIGFLSCKNIDVSFDHIYIDPSTYKVHLVYLPLNKRLYEDDSIFENELRAGLIKLISGISALSSPKTMQFSVDLSNGALSLEDLANKVWGGKIIEPVVEPEIPKEKNGKLYLVAMNAPTRVELEVTKDEYIIGRNSAVVDGLVSFNRMIGRVHCKINVSGKQITVTDLQSSNGTFVNQKRLQPHQPYAIKNGDILRLANSDFKVSMQ